MQKVLATKHLIGRNPYTHLGYADVVNNTVKVMNRNNHNDISELQTLLKNNKQISLLLNEIETSLNPYKNNLDWTMRYFESYQKNYGHRRRFKWVVGGSLITVTFLYILYFRICFYMEHSFDLFRPNIKTVILRFIEI